MIGRTLDVIASLYVKDGVQTKSPQYETCRRKSLSPECYDQKISFYASTHLHVDFIGHAAESLHVPTSRI